MSFIEEFEALIDKHANAIRADDGLEYVNDIVFDGFLLDIRVYIDCAGFDSRDPDQRER